MIRLLFSWAISSTLCLLVVSVLCGYAFLSRPVKLIPFQGDGFEISDLSYSPNYLSDMAKKVAQLRLTFNPETVVSQYAELIHITENKEQEAQKEFFNEEIKVIKQKEISSVFYPKTVSVDVKKHQAVLEGELHRSSHGIPLKMEHRKYEIDFAFHGSLYLLDIKEISND